MAIKTKAITIIVIIILTINSIIHVSHVRCELLHLHSIVISMFARSFANQLHHHHHHQRSSKLTITDYCHHHHSPGHFRRHPPSISREDTTTNRRVKLWTMVLMPCFTHNRRVLTAYRSTLCFCRYKPWSSWWLRLKSEIVFPNALSQSFGPGGLRPRSHTLADCPGWVGCFWNVYSRNKTWGTAE